MKKHHLGHSLLCNRSIFGTHHCAKLVPESKVCAEDGINHCACETTCKPLTRIPPKRYWGRSLPNETTVNIFTEYCPEGSLYKYIRVLKSAVRGPGLMQGEDDEVMKGKSTLEQSVVPLARVQEYTRQIVSAMDIVHNKIGIYHGRITSKSILIADNGTT